ncbi:tetraspanin [Microdochium bolleyi]|uniref:Tetraspanin n=1 Tax=Microdochium bolleyi TaxID=196109 RepID=A0A136JA02_9PEZI|nr:tetraspanin [Microdochium bolleyi]
MVNKILAAFVFADFMFAVGGALMLGFSVIVQQTVSQQATDGMEVAKNLLYRDFPFNVGIANAVLTFIIFAFTLPGLATGSRGWLKVAGYLVVVNALFTMGIGINLWTTTLKMRERFSGIWVAQPAEVQSLLQTAFSCCGFTNSTSPAFVTNPTCPSPASSALMRGCAAPLSAFGNNKIDVVFTAVFGMVGLDALLIMALACLLKDRKERERYRHIDEKSGARMGGF